MYTSQAELLILLPWPNLIISLPLLTSVDPIITLSASHHRFLSWFGWSLIHQVLLSFHLCFHRSHLHSVKPFAFKVAEGYFLEKTTFQRRPSKQFYSPFSFRGQRAFSCCSFTHVATWKAKFKKTTTTTFRNVSI